MRSTSQPALLASAPRRRKSSQQDNQSWRQDNIGRLLSNALQHFEARVLELLARAGHHEITASHINATRHMHIDGTRLTSMAQNAAMTKQSMSELVAQLERLGMVARRPDPLDGRARIVHFTPQGLRWLNSFRQAVEQAEIEMAALVGPEALGAVKQALRRYSAHQPEPSG